MVRLKFFTHWGLVSVSGLVSRDAFERQLNVHEHPRALLLTYLLTHTRAPPTILFSPSAASGPKRNGRGPRPRQEVLYRARVLVHSLQAESSRASKHLVTLETPARHTRTPASDTSSRARGTRSRRVRLRANGAL